MYSEDFNFICMYCLDSNFSSHQKFLSSSNIKTFIACASVNNTHSMYKAQRPALPKLEYTILPTMSQLQSEQYFPTQTQRKIT